MKPQNEELIRQAYRLFGVSDPLGFQRAYTSHDQTLMKSRQWSAYNPELIINRAKVILEQMDFDTLGEQEKLWFTEVLWFWYHHAISSEVLRSRAREYADKALSLMDDEHPNRITRLLWYLTRDDVDGAKAWLCSEPKRWDEIEIQNGHLLVEDYERRAFWV